MKRVLMLALGFSMGANAGDPNCAPDVGSVFNDYLDKAYSITNDVAGSNSLFSQCTNMSDQQLIGVLNGCGPLTHPINGLGLSPSDQFLYGLMPTDTMGIGTHVSFDDFPFLSPGEPGDMMKADPVDVYRIGNDGGYQKIGFIDPPTEDLTLPGDDEQVIPIVHSASSFDNAGNMFVLGYKTNYDSSANVMAGTGQVLYKAPKIMIGRVSAVNLTAANGVDAIPAIWSEAVTSGSCSAVMDQFAFRTNTFSQCVVADFIDNGNADNAIASCLASTSVLDYGIHDFAVSPLDGNYFALDTMSYADKDVLIEVNSTTMVATCTEYADVGNSTGVLTSLMFSGLNKLVAIYSDASTGNWYDISQSPPVLNNLVDAIAPFPFGDGSSLPFDNPRRSSHTMAGVGDIIFRNGFETELIFANGFEGTIQPPTCPVF